MFMMAGARARRTNRWVGLAVAVAVLLTASVSMAEDEPGPFKIGIATNFGTTIDVPDGAKGVDVIHSGLFWRYRFADWFLLGGAMMVGTDVGDFGTDLLSVRWEIASGTVQIPVSDIVRPYFRAGFGLQSQSLDNRVGVDQSVADDLPVHGDGIFIVAAPGVAFQPLSWLYMHLEFQTNVYTDGGLSSDDTPVQLGGAFAIGVSL